MTLASRLLVSFLLTLAGVLAAFSAAVDLLARAHLRQTIDDALAGDLNALAGSVEVEPRGVEWEPDKPRLLATRPAGGATRWVVRGDRPIPNAQSDDPPGSPPLPEFGRADARPFDYVDAHGQPWRAAELTFRSDGATPPPGEPNFHTALRVTIAVGVGPARRNLRNLEVALFGASVMILGAAAVGGRRVCRRALMPVRRMAGAVQGITAADLGARLTVPSPNDELRELAVNFNGLLARLEESFERQRRFTAEASHQLRTPLTALRGSLEVALRRERDPADYRRVLGAAVAQTDRLTGIVESLLFLARADAEARTPDLEAVELGGWLARHLDDTWGDHPRAADLRRTVESDGPLTVLAQPTLLAQAFDNVLDNAFKCSEPGTVVEVRLHGDAATVTLAVRDGGIGIPPDALPRVFEPFFRAENSRLRGVKGHGLGLAVTARIVAAFGGRVSAAANSPAGTVVAIRLPAVAAAVVST